MDEFDEIFNNTDAYYENLWLAYKNAKDPEINYRYKMDNLTMALAEFVLSSCKDNV